MATQPADLGRAPPRFSRFYAELRDPTRCIAAPRFDALYLWGVPVLALLFVELWLGLASLLPAPLELRMAGFLGVLSALLTYAHLVAVAPRAYLNQTVFRSHRLKLTVVPVLLLGALLVSPACFVIGTVLSVFWDAHHSAMQNFGLARIYDMKAGNPPLLLRRTDMRLNWMLYIGPLAAGASLPFHFQSFGQFQSVGWGELAALPGVLEGRLDTITQIAVVAWLTTLAWAGFDYARAVRAGYRIPAHKLVMTASTGLVSVLAWGFSSPPVALAAINIYHAIQYFALVWLKEGTSLQAFFGAHARRAFDLFILFCALVAGAYALASHLGAQWLLAPFIACSLLHFWFDGFVWSVRKQQV
jgi:hypothetical protein